MSRGSLPGKRFVRRGFVQKGLCPRWLCPVTIIIMACSICPSQSICTFMTISLLWFRFLLVYWEQIIILLPG